jgi:hypothetical protein
MRLGYGDIQARWEARVVPNGWHRLGRHGADAYVRKYGRGIGLEKLMALREFARIQGFPEFAAGLEIHIAARKLSNITP